MPSNTVSGNTMIILLAWSYNGCPPSFTDSQGNTYTAKASGAIEPIIGGAFWVFTAPIGSSAACTITLSAACGSIQYGFAAEVSGLQSDPFDQINGVSDSTSPCNAGSVTPTTNGQYIAALFYRATNATSYAARGGFTKREEWNSNSAAWQDFVQPTAGAITPDMDVGSVNASYPVAGLVATFKATITVTSKRPMPTRIILPSDQQNRNLYE